MMARETGASAAVKSDEQRKKNRQKIISLLS